MLSFDLRPQPGFSLQAWALLKGARHALQWKRQLGTTRGESGSGVSADGLGNVYVTGNTGGNLSGINPATMSTDAFVSKYNAVGELQWTRQSGASEDDYGNHVAADSFGNVFISGYTSGAVAGPNAIPKGAFLTKYSAAGALQWTQYFGTSAYDERNIATDGLGNVYFVGSDALKKYDSDGNLLWARQSESSLFGVSADGLGNVYVSGSSLKGLHGPNAGSTDTFVSKYDAAGLLQWTRQFGTSGTDEGYGVAADKLGNVFVAGFTYGNLGGRNAGGPDAYIAKLGVPEPSMILLVALAFAPLVCRRTNSCGNHQRELSRSVFRWID